MQYVGRLVSTVYNSITPNINPATLSGAIDIIVVQRQVEKQSTPADGDGDGDDGKDAGPQQAELTTELASTPFHVRFGKMSVLRPAERKVTLHLNGSPEPLPFHMKVGDTGEAFFVLEVDEEDSSDIPDALVTSPLLSATGSPIPGSDLDSLEGDDDSRSGAFDVEPLDLGASVVTPADTIDPTRAASQAAFVQDSNQGESAADAIARLSLDDHDLDSEVRSAAASSQRTAVETAIPVSTKELDTMLDMDGYKVTGEAGQDHRHHHFSSLLRRAAQEEDPGEDVEEELRREAENFFGGTHQRTLSNPQDMTHRLLARAKSDPALDVTAASAAEIDGHSAAEKIMEKVVRGPAAAPRTLADITSSTSAGTKDKKFVKTLRLSSDQLKTLNLKKGLNTISFSVTSSYSGVATCTARIFLWDSSFQVVVSDIDGTITKSDALGHVFTMIGRDWTHLGVAKLYTDIARNGYHIMYLTSRAVGQADVTRDYLKNINQNGYRLPEGPVIMSPDRLMTSLHREVILRKPEVFKMACLRDIARLFGCDFRGGPPAAPHAGGHSTGALVPPTSAQTVGAELQKQGLESVAAAGAHANHSSTPTPFFAGFGNRITDALSYRSVNVPSSRIFTIDWNGEVKMELLELAGYNTSYVKMNELVDQFFPPMRAAEVSNPRQREYNDVTFWRAPIDDIELPLDELSPPVSPALSARSGLSIRSSISIRSSASRRSATTSVLDNNNEERSPGGGAGGERGNSSGGRLSRFGLSSLGLSRRESTSVTPEAPRNATWAPASPASPQKSKTQAPSGATAGGGAAAAGTAARPGIPFPESVSSPDVLMDDDDPLLAQGEVRFDWK